MARMAIYAESENKPAPNWAMFWGFNDTPYDIWFESKDDAIRFARMNEAIIKDMETDEIIIDTLNHEENGYEEY